MKLHRSFHTVKVEKQAHNYYYPSLKTELSLERMFYFSFAGLGFHTKAITALSTQTEVKKESNGIVIGPQPASLLRVTVCPVRAVCSPRRLAPFIPLFLFINAFLKHVRSVIIDDIYPDTL